MPVRGNAWLTTLVRLFGLNWITLLGASVTPVSAILILALILLGLLPVQTPPYIGIMAFMVLPGIFVSGLLLMPLGVYVARRSFARRTGSAAATMPYPALDFNLPRVRRAAALLLLLTLANLFVISLVSYEGYHYMDSVSFCGRTCHTVMEPEYAAYHGSPHSRVKCVECHIGPGAPWFVRAKLSGLGQVLAVATGRYERPIPTPVKNLRPSRDTCEQCHWPERFAGDRLKVLTKFSDDERNTRLSTALLMHIGGGNRGRGIHSWHIDPRRQTSYIALDRGRQHIARVQVVEGDGKVTEYVSEAEKLFPEQIPSSERRTMDCIDCHNRPTHIFRFPDQVVDEALAAGRIDATLPFIKKASVAALAQAGGPKSDALRKIARLVDRFYQEKYPDLDPAKRGSVQAAIHEIQAIYGRNVFPDMNQSWGTHPDNLGHERFPGCFRCHDEEHKSADGRVIGQDCDLCHAVLAVDEEHPEVLTRLQPGAQGG